MRKHLTYANVVASLALFLALSGGAVYAANKIGAGQLKPNAVTAGKIRASAVTASKLRKNAVTEQKLRAGAVTFAKLAAGTNLLASASGGPIAATSTTAAPVPLAGTTTFTPAAGAASLLSVEAKGINLARTGEAECEARIVPLVNGSEWRVAEGALAVRAFAPSARRPTGLAPQAGVTGPIGLASPGVTQTVSVEMIGDTDCAPGSAVAVGIAVTQAK